ncbi:MAG: nicotinate-nucleotide--dimethylbenzimidazole phosphoribosyltransferase [Candidatus Firestonebacteria bacterium RIFOXYC2_FULL_39_67]|nr:MAG: nicotinate-nucleotide--dimethylbenzimidazole phosphoribosyltransferase [Candidatus Firestonebacteria bacterium RIFOXYD2_FULL_39_29]OGF52417.1 MAG: nicotinate-nucleotide--dimethylbenzimidazole phosphoribosyltransferase [Candidatus Firestonebacteria bacterium RifOxyC12_full_39_7]OGF56801.1 MAG: nicotinate-nucleotide--dimethylbenzimidazole phosphoribosyltransferase [Candidatus Firestonebacteria bacterium RIFOXYC2_FULL_39_67]
MKIGKHELKISGTDKNLLSATQKRLDFLTKPLSSLGRLEEIAKTVVAISGKKNPVLNNKVIFTMAGDHGIAREGVSAYPMEVTPQMVLNFLNGGAGINVIARHVGAKVIIVDMGVNYDFKGIKGLVDKKIGMGTKSFTSGPAMTREDALKSIEAGIDVVFIEKELDIIGTGDMGIGNTSPSAAITSIYTGKAVKEVTGRGTGIDDKGLANKIALIEKGIAVNKPDRRDAIDVLSKVGGFEIGGLAGVILGGAMRKVPVVIDGFISTAAALIAVGIEPKAGEYIIASHNSVENGHKFALEHLKLKPILNLELRLGEGTGAALSMSIIEAAVKILNEMATFESAGVSNK